MRRGNGGMLWDVIGGDRTWRLSTCLFSSLRRSDRHKRGVLGVLHFERLASRLIQAVMIVCQGDDDDRDKVDGVDEVWWKEARTRKAGDIAPRLASGGS
jgi:hypothetical protein